MEDIIKIVKSLEDSGLLLKGFSETIQSEIKEQKRGFLSMLLGTSGPGLLGNILVRKGINKAGEGIYNIYGAYVINLDKYSDIGTHWIALNALNVFYFDNFGVERISKEIIFLEYKHVIQ